MCCWNLNPKWHVNSDTDKMKKGYIILLNYTLKHFGRRQKRGSKYKGRENKEYKAMENKMNRRNEMQKSEPEDEKEGEGSRKPRHKRESQIIYLFFWYMIPIYYCLTDNLCHCPPASF